MSKLEHFDPSNPSIYAYREGSPGYHTAMARLSSQSESIARQQAKLRGGSYQGTSDIGGMFFWILMAAWIPPALLIWKWEELAAMIPLGDLGLWFIILLGAGLLIYRFPRASAVMMLVWAGTLLIPGISSRIAMSMGYVVSSDMVRDGPWMIAGGVVLLAGAIFLLRKTRPGVGWPA